MQLESTFCEQLQPQTTMLALIQRVTRAKVTVDNRVTGEIAQGLLVLVCAEPTDSEVQANKLVDKLLKLRVFSDDAGKMNRSVSDVGGGLLLVSQFTLAADTSGGNRPSFAGAAPAALGEALYEQVVARARALHPIVATGEFGADMQVELLNDGPVTIPMKL
jgi:D-aminoacyl-tRNA deacylase